MGLAGVKPEQLPIILKNGFDASTSSA